MKPEDLNKSGSPSLGFGGSYVHMENSYHGQNGDGTMNFNG
jgi:hypothetical protein